MSQLVPTMLLAFDKSALHMALEEYAVESEQIARINSLLDDSGDSDGEVDFQESDVTFICDTLIPWAQNSLLDERPNDAQAEMAHGHLRKLVERIKAPA